MVGFVLGNDVSPSPSEVFVAVAMVVMEVGVDHKCHRQVGQLGNGGGDLVRQRGELVIHDEGAVITDRYSDVASTALQHVDVVPHRDGGDLNTVEILGQGSGRQKQAWQCQEAE